MARRHHRPGRRFKGRRFSARKRAANQAWVVVQKHFPELVQAQCEEIIETWLKNGVLYEQEYYDTKLRGIRMGLFVNDAKRPN
jgi:hypothetical protein